MAKRKTPIVRIVAHGECEDKNREASILIQAQPKVKGHTRGINGIHVNIVTSVDESVEFIHSLRRAIMRTGAPDPFEVNDAKEEISSETI